MLDREERVLLVKSRINEREHKKNALVRRGIEISSVVGCFLIIILLSFSIPGVVSDFENISGDGAQMTASIFNLNQNIGYIIVGIIAFLLGVCVTVLCHKIKKLEMTQKDSEDKDD